MRMLQTEIDEISNTFSEAWHETFGMSVYYLRRKEGVQVTTHPLYDETIGKNLEEDYEYIGPIPAIFAQEVIEQQLTESGLDSSCQGILTLVSKDLRDKGILSVSRKDMFSVTDRDGVTSLYNILDSRPTVQFVDNYIFLSVDIKRYGT